MAIYNEVQALNYAVASQTVFFPLAFSFGALALTSLLQREGIVR